jgi:hypothetical protein
MSGRQGKAESSLIIGGERCDFRSLLVLHDKSGIRERFRTRSVRPDRPTLSWTKGNYSLFLFLIRIVFAPKKSNQEHQNCSEFSELHYLISLATRIGSKRLVI